MNRIIAKVKFIGTFLAVAVMCLPAMSVCASELDGIVETTGKTYTVTFRPGNVGCFALNSGDEGTKQEKAEAVASQEYGDYVYEVTTNGAIKVTVDAYDVMPAAPRYIQAETGYFAKDASVWGPATEQTVDKNMDFVVDYGKLVDGVEYTVEYIDSSSGESVAPIYIARANIGDPRTVTAPKQIVISEGTVYNLTSAEVITKDLVADSTQNIFTFSYTVAPRGTVEQEIVNYVDGGTVTTTETFTTLVNNGTTVTPVQGQGGGAGANAGGEAEAENEAGNIVIEDEQVPLAPADSEEENIGNTVTIGEEDVPLANFSEENEINTVAVVAGVFVVAAIAALIVRLLLKSKKNTDNVGEDNNLDD